MLHHGRSEMTMEVTTAFTSRGNLDSPVSSACFGFSQSVYSEISSLCLLERSEAHPLCPMTNGWSGNTWKICVHKSKKIFFCLTVEQPRDMSGLRRGLARSRSFKASTTEEIRDCTRERMSACPLNQGHTPGRNSKLWAEVPHSWSQGPPESQRWP